MNTKSKLGIAVGSVVLAGSLAFGASAFAASGIDGTGSAGQDQVVPHLTAQQKCDKQAQIAQRVAHVDERITTREATLKDHLAKAQAAGKTEAVTRIQARIDRLDALSQKVDARYATYQTWVAAHCDATGTTTTVGS